MKADEGRGALWMGKMKKWLFRQLGELLSGRTRVRLAQGTKVDRALPGSVLLEARLRAARAAGVIEWNGEKWRPAGAAVRVRGTRTVAALMIRLR